MQITNVVERAIVLLASQFRKSSSTENLSNMQKFVKAFAESIQDLENANWQLKTERNLDNSQGVQLDGLGQILGLDREEDESDTDYRERLKFQIFINQSHGTPEELIAILIFITNATKVRYIEFYPAAFQMITNGQTFPTPPEEIITAIQDASPVGVQYCPVTATYGVNVPFVFAGDFESEKLVITDPANPESLTNLELDTGNLLYVNPQKSVSNSEGGGFSEALGTYPTYTIDETGAGQFCEVIQYNGNLPPTS